MACVVPMKSCRKNEMRATARSDKRGPRCRTSQWLQRHSGAPPLAVQQGFVVVQIYADSRGGKQPRACACRIRVLSSAACVKRCESAYLQLAQGTCLHMHASYSRHVMGRTDERSFSSSCFVSMHSVSPVSKFPGSFFLCTLG